MYVFIYHILPSLISGFMFFILISVVITVFRIKHPAIRVLLYVLVLYKVVESMIMKTVGVGYSRFNITLRIVDPFNNVPNSLDRSYKPLVLIGGPFINNFIIMIFIMCFIFIVIRWFKLWRFYSSLSRDNLIENGDCFKIEKIVDKYSKIFKANKPKVVLSTTNYCLPATVGIVKPVLVLSPKMIDSLDEKELEVIIAHEFSHIKRKDNIFQWFVLALKDVTFFNPFSFLIYKKYLLFKELAADNLVKSKTKITQRQINKCVDIVRSFVVSNKLKELPSSSHLLSSYRTKLKYKKTENKYYWTPIKIVLTALLFMLLVALQWIIILPIK